MLLGEGKRFGIEGLRFQAGIHVPLKSEDRLLGIVWAEVRVPIHKPRMIQRSDVFANPHQRLDILGRHSPGVFDQLRSKLEKLGLCCLSGPGRCFVIQGLGW